MFLTGLCLWYSVLYLVQAENDTGVEPSCPADFRYVDSGTTINITEMCNDEMPCITKCCPENQILFSYQCENVTNLTLIFNVTGLDDYSGIKIYKKNIRYNIIESSKNMNNFTRIYSNDILKCAMDTKFIFSPPVYHIYILENGSLVGSRANYRNPWFLHLPTGQFCVENELVLNPDGNAATKPQLTTWMVSSEPGKVPDQKNTITAYAMLVSSFFLVLVLAVYAVLPQLQNLAGMMLMAYVATLITGFVFRAIQIFGTTYGVLTTTECLVVGFILHYTMIGSFTWMNVMSFDIWWSMRGFRKLRQIHRRGILVKFAWYGLYGWGAPLVPVLFIVIVEHLDLTHLPNFVTPHFLRGGFCFMQEDERQLYMDGPIFITTCVNIALFLMTAYNIWRIKTGVSKHSAGESRRNRQDETRFGIYLKLSVVMGIFWILEVMSSVFNQDSRWWYIPDLFNSLVGLFVFIIFICKRKIVVLLCKRFSIENEFVRKWQPVESTRSNDTQLSSKKKMLDPVTESSDADELEKKY